MKSSSQLQHQQQQSLSLRSRVVPGLSKRCDFTLQPRVSALLIVDIQSYLEADGDDDSAKNSTVEDEAERRYFRDVSHPRTVRNVGKLLQAFRSGMFFPHFIDRLTQTSSQYHPHFTVTLTNLTCVAFDPISFFLNQSKKHGIGIRILPRPAAK